MGRAPALASVAATFALLLLSKAAVASIVQNIDTKTKTYANDGDGMSYVVSEAKKISVDFDEVLRNPLDAKGQIRYIPTQDNKKIDRILAPAGKSGLRYSRPLADMEIIAIKEAIVKMNQVTAATDQVFDPNIDPGSVLERFAALSDGKDCPITLYEKSAEICGVKFGRSGIVNWTMFEDVSGCSLSGICWWRNFEFTVGYESKIGRKAVSFNLTNKQVAKKFIQVFSAWGGSTPQRI